MQTAYSFKPFQNSGPKHTSKFKKDVINLCCLGNDFMYRSREISICTILAMFWQYSNV